MKKHTPTLQTSQTLHNLLKERGECMETEFYWWKDKESKVTCLNHGTPEATEEWYEIYPAPLLTELLERLPSKVLYQVYHDHLWQIEAYDHKFIGDNPAESAALMLIHLLTNGLI